MLIDSKLYRIPARNPMKRLDSAIRLLCLTASLSKADKDLLDKILAATHLPEEQICHLSIDKESIALGPLVTVEHKLLVLCFGLTPDQVGLQIKAPSYKPFTLFDMTCVFMDELAQFNREANLKKYLWNLLKSELSIV